MQPLTLKTAEEEVNEWACCSAPENQVRAEHLISQIKDAVSKYHHALDARQHGGIAAHKCVDEIETILKMPWIQGANKKIK